MYAEWVHNTKLILSNHLLDTVFNKKINSNAIAYQIIKQHVRIYTTDILLLLLLTPSRNILCLKIKQQNLLKNSKSYLCSRRKPVMVYS